MGTYKMIVLKRFSDVSRKEIYAIGILAAFTIAGIFTAQPVAAQSVPDTLAESDIDIPMPDLPKLAPSGDASNPQINSNTIMNLIP
jgi:hypothetical protein